MKVKTSAWVASAGVVLGVTLPAPASDPNDVDVEVWLSPVLAPSGSDQTTEPPPTKLKLDPGDPFFLEVWVSDVGHTNTGVISMYLDITYDNAAATDATAITHSGKFNLFPEGVIDNPAGAVWDFGGSDPTFTGQGIEPEIARLGYIAFDYLGPERVNLSGVVDPILGCGAVGRDCGKVLIHSAGVPEPASVILLGAGLAFLRRRRSC